MKSRLLFAIFGLAVLVGCSSNGGPDASSRPTDKEVKPSENPSPAVSVASPSSTETLLPSASAPTLGCENGSSIASNHDLILPGSLRGDVDGDGSPDTVTIALDPQGGEGCRAFLVLRLAASTLLAPIPQWEPTPALPAPHLNSLVEITPDSGSEIVVDVTAGASTQFEGVYTVLAGRLVPVMVTGTPSQGLFAYGGSVGHLDGQACTPGGSVVISSAVVVGPSGVRYRVVRRFFRASGNLLTYEPDRTQRRDLRLSAMQHLPEFFGAPFARCPSG